MRLTKPLAVAAAGALALSMAACGGNGGSNGNGNPSANQTYKQGGNAGAAKDATAKGPAQPIPNATGGGTVTVLYPSPDTGLATLDPSPGWSVTGNAIEQDLVARSLTTFRQDPKTGQMTLVPDLATDLGQHNANFTQWTFTLKSGIKYENGKPVTAQDIKYGIERSFDTGSLIGPGSQYSTEYFLDGDKYKGPYDKATKGQDYKGVTVSGNKITIKMSKPFPDMDYWGSFEAMGPIPSGKVSDPPKYGLHPWATGPYKVQSFQPNQQLVLVKNNQWDPNTDPSRHQYVDKWIMKFDQDPEKTDQIALSGNQASQTTITTSILAQNYADAKQKLGDRLVQGTQPCTSFLYPDYKKISNIKIRQAIGYAYPYQDAWAAAGEVVGVTRVPGNAILPPGLNGRQSYGPIDGQQVTHNTAKAKALLKAAGVKPHTYTLSWIYKKDDPQGVKASQQIEKAYQAAGFKTNPIGVTGSPYDTWTNPDDKINKSLNIRGVAWCSDWPSGLTFIPPLFQSNQLYNTGYFSEKSVDDRINQIPTMPLGQQAAAWGDLDKMIETKYYPAVNTGYLNVLMTYGSKIGNFQNDPNYGAPNYRDIYVKK